MSSKEHTYKVTLSGADIIVKDRTISEEIALKIISLIMGCYSKREWNKFTNESAAYG